MGCKTVRLISLTNYIYCWMILIGFAACQAYWHIFSCKWKKKCYEQINVQFDFQRLLFFITSKLIFVSMERTCSRKMLVHRLYIATGINALRRGASRKLSIKTLRSAISLHPHYSIVTIARLRQLRSPVGSSRLHDVSKVLLAKLIHTLIIKST